MNSLVAAEVRRIVSARLRVNEDRVRYEASFVEDLGADSLARVDLTLSLEEAFDIEIEDEEFGAIRTVGEAIRLVERRVAGRAVTMDG